MSKRRYRNAIRVKESGTIWLAPVNPLVDTSARYDDIFYTAKEGDRLDLLAHRFLNDARLWWIIAEYNNKFWMFDIEVGETLRIPSYEHMYLDLMR